MSEINNKYTIYEKKFDHVNWIGFWTLYKKEVLRFLIVVIQTVISPLVTSLLFLLVLLWAIRLGAFLFHRVLIKGEDRRFKEWKYSFPLFLNEGLTNTLIFTLLFI